MSDDVLFLGGKEFHSQPKYARDRRVDVRTIARKREKGLPWIFWAGMVWIQPDEGDAYLLSTQRRRRNPPRSPRGQSPKNRDTAA